MKKFSCLLAALLMAGLNHIALAHGGHGQHARTRTHVGVYFGPSLGWNWHYPGANAYPSYPYPSYAYPPYAYPTPVVIVPAAPITYIERPQPEQQSLPTSGNDWYYHCRRPEGYYPYVRQCPDGWQRVPAQPPQ